VIVFTLWTARRGCTFLAQHGIFSAFALLLLEGAGVPCPFRATSSCLWSVYACIRRTGSCVKRRRRWRVCDIVWCCQGLAENAELPALPIERRHS
jgi:hypothetical protein